MSAATAISAEEFDRRFDDGEDMSDYLDWSTFRRPGLAPKRVNLDMPQHMVAKLDTHARKGGVTRQALIKMWLADRLEVA
jgi:CopG antitoxin of type II toxin-antitoxin system